MEIQVEVERSNNNKLMIFGIVIYLLFNFYNYNARGMIQTTQNMKLRNTRKSLFHSIIRTRATAVGSSRSSTDNESMVLINYPLSVHYFIDREILRFLNLPNHLRKGRFTLPRRLPSDSCDEKLLREYIENKTPLLQHRPYVLRYKLSSQPMHEFPKRFLQDSNSSSLTYSHPTLGQNVYDAINACIESESSLQLFVQIAPGIFPHHQSDELPVPNSQPSVKEANNHYAEWWKIIDTFSSTALDADPLESESYTMISFYAFHNISEPDDFATFLRVLWNPFYVEGRVYVSPTEGVNAQVAVPTNVLKAFQSATKSVPLFKSCRINADPHRIKRSEYESTRPFRNLHIRIRKQIVADGFDVETPIARGNGDTAEFDWSRAGKEMDPLTWHRHLSRGTDDNGREVVVLDCRNSYESDVGLFKGAVPLNTTFFRESWSVLDEMLQDTPKDTPILTYCTGGIRCVKINAYLQQRLGFSNTHRLQGGIISYAREIQQQADKDTEADSVVEIINPNYEAHTLEEKNPQNAVSSNGVSSSGVESMFVGVNYVFDERIGERITDDVLTRCEMCAAPCDSFNNCRSNDCNVRFLQCHKCSSSYGGCCSKSCQIDSRNGLGLPLVSKKTSNRNMLSRSDLSKRERPRRGELRHALEQSAVSGEESDVKSFEDAINAYCQRLSTAEPPLLQQLRQDTEARYSFGAARMLSGPLQGRLLAALCTISGARNILEIGTFTGYSALCLAAGLDVTGLEPMPNPRTSKLGRKVTTCEIDSEAANKAQEYFAKAGLEHVIRLERKPAATVIDEIRKKLNDGDLSTKFDMVFLDADKKQYWNYLQQLMGDITGDGRPFAGPSLLSDGAIIVVDNTLWKGLVLKNVDDLAEWAHKDSETSRNPKRMQVLADAMHQFNVQANEHPRLRQLLLPLRDGLSILRYSSNNAENSKQDIST